MTAPKTAVPAILLLLGGCAGGAGQLDETGGITAIRSACPMVAIPASTGDITLFNPPTSRDAAALDVTATMTNVRATCADTAEAADVATTVTFDVRARRTHAEGARDVSLPYFIAVVRGGSAVVAKRMGRVSVHFEAGRDRAGTSGQASTTIARAAATLSSDVRKRLTEKRKAGGEDAAVDPLSRPEVRQAVLRATFEALVGFQLTDDQLKYNATR